MDQKKRSPKKIPAHVADAQYALSSAAVRGESKEVLDKLRDKLEAAKLSKS